MATEDLCIGCSEPLIITVEASDEEITTEDSVAPGIVDDVKLSCGHHYHWYSCCFPLVAQPKFTDTLLGPALQKNIRPT